MDLCMDLLSRDEMVMGGSPERLSTQPPTDAIHEEGSCSSSLPAFSSQRSLWRPRTASATPRSSHCRRGLSALRHGPQRSRCPVLPAGPPAAGTPSAWKQRVVSGLSGQPSWTAVVPAPGALNCHSPSLC